MSADIRDLQKKRWEELLPMLSEERRADALNFLARPSLAESLESSRSRLKKLEEEIKETESQVDQNRNKSDDKNKLKNKKKALKKQKKQIKALESMQNRAFGRYVDDEIIKQILLRYGISFTLVNRSKTREMISVVDAENPLLDHHRHAILVHGSDRTDSTAASGHFQSGTSDHKEKGIDLRLQNLFTPEASFCIWKKTPGDGDCGLHAAYEILQAAKDEICKALDLTDEKTAISPTVKARSSYAPAPTASLSGRTTHFFQTNRERIEALCRTDALIKAEAETQLEKLTDQELKQLGSRVSQKYSGIQCATFDDTTRREDYIYGIATVMQAMNHHEKLEDVTKLVTDEIKLGLETSVPHESIFATLERSVEISDDPLASKMSAA